MEAEVMANLKAMAEGMTAKTAETTWRQRQWLCQKQRLQRWHGCNARATLIVEAKVDAMVVARGNGRGNSGKGEDSIGNSGGRSKGRGDGYMVGRRR
jgi:hypothetical protein